MVGSNNWPSMGQQPPENIHEHGTILHANTKSMLARVQKKDSMPMAVTELWLSEVIRYMELTKNLPMQTDVMDALDKLTTKISSSHEKLEEDTTIIRKTITEFSLPSSSSSVYSKNSSQSWSSVVSSGVASKASTIMKPKPTINKNTEIIVRLNDSEQKQVLQKVPSQDIVEDINARIMQLETATKGIRAIKKLPSGDIAVHTVNEEEADKLRSNSAWTAVLGKKAKAVVQSYAIIVTGIETEEWDLRSEESRTAAMRKIQDQNEDVEALKNMEITWIGWRQKRIPKDQKYATMILKVSTPEMGNAILDLSLMVGRQVRACSVINKACRTIQCFKCYYYGHTTVQCTREERCGHCAGAHPTNSEACLTGYKPKCCLCGGGHKPWQKECPEKKKEIQRILIAKGMTPRRFEVRGRVAATKNSPYFNDDNFGNPGSQLMALDGPETTGKECTGEYNNKRFKNGITFGGTRTPNLSQAPTGNKRTSHSVSPAKGRGKAAQKEADKGGAYSGVNRTPLKQRDVNTVTRSSQRLC